MSFDKNNQNPNQKPGQQQPGKTTDRPMQDDRNKQGNDRSKTQQGGYNDKNKQK